MRILIATVLVLVSCGAAWAQPSGIDPSFERMRAKLKAGDRVTVDVQDGSSVEGRVVDADPDSLSISASGADRRFARSEVVRVQRHGHGMLLGAIIGGGVGLASGVAVGTYFNNEGHDGDRPLFGLTALGLGLGIGIDAVVNNPHTLYQRSPSRTTVNVEAGPRRAAVRVVVAF
jgi:hypothetical protein